MSFKKSWPGYVIWAVYALAVMLLLTLYGVAAGIFPGENPPVFAAFCAALLLIAAGAVSVFWMKLTEAKARETDTVGRSAAASLNVIGVMLVLGGAIGGRIGLFENEIVRDPKTFLMQIGILIIFYFAVLAALGRLAAFLALVYLAGVPMLFMLTAGASASEAADTVYTMPFRLAETAPDRMPVMLLFTAALLFVTLYLKESAKTGRKGGALFLTAFLTGVVYGVLLRFDAAGLTLLPLLLSVFFLESVRAGRAFGQTVCVLIGALAGFATAFIFPAADMQNALPEASARLLQWTERYFAAFADVTAWRLPYEAAYRGLYPVTAALLLFAVFSFFRARERECLSPWMLATVLAVGLLPLMGHGDPGWQTDRLLLFFAVMIGGGIGALMPTAAGDAAARHGGRRHRREGYQAPESKSAAELSGRERKAREAEKTAREAAEREATEAMERARAQEEKIAREAAEKLAAAERKAKEIEEKSRAAAAAMAEFESHIADIRAEEEARVKEEETRTEGLMEEEETKVEARAEEEEKPQAKSEETRAEELAEAEGVEAEETDAKAQEPLSAMSDQGEAFVMPPELAARIAEIEAEEAAAAAKNQMEEAPAAETAKMSAAEEKMAAEEAPGKETDAAAAEETKAGAAEMPDAGTEEISVIETKETIKPQDMEETKTVSSDMGEAKTETMFSDMGEAETASSDAEENIKSVIPPELAARIAELEAIEKAARAEAQVAEEPAEAEKTAQEALREETGKIEELPEEAAPETKEAAERVSEESRRTLYIPEGMILPLGEEDLDDTAQPRIKLPDYSGMEPIELKRTARPLQENNLSEKVPETIKTGVQEPGRFNLREFDLELEPGDDFDI